MNNFENVKLDRGMYKITGKSFSEVLENQDDSAQYKDTAFGSLDAYQRQLKRFDIKVASASCDTVEKFFKTADSATLFPEYLSRAVRQGLDETAVIPSIIAAKTKVDSLDYRSICSTPTDDEKELKAVAEGAIIPSTQIHLKDNLIRLYKRGRRLVSSYEALRFQKLDVFTVTLKQIGAYIAKSQLKDAVNVLINGDGNNNAAEVISAKNKGELCYEDLLKLWGSFSGYEMNTLLVSSDTMVKLLSIAEIRDPAAAIKVTSNGTYIPVLGATVIKSDCVPDGKIIAFDKKCALEMVVADEISVEHDKLINRQLEETAVTSISGFAKLFPEAVKVLEI